MPAFGLFQMTKAKSFHKYLEKIIFSKEEWEEGGIRGKTQRSSSTSFLRKKSRRER